MQNAGLYINWRSHIPCNTDGSCVSISSSNHYFFFYSGLFRKNHFEAFTYKRSTESDTTLMLDLDCRIVDFHRPGTAHDNAALTVNGWFDFVMDASDARGTISVLELENHVEVDFQMNTSLMDYYTTQNGERDDGGELKVGKRRTYSALPDGRLTLSGLPLRHVYLARFGKSK